MKDKLTFDILGIGKALLETYLARPNHTLIAGVRDTNSSTSQSLLTLPHGPNSSVMLVRIDSASEADALTAISTLKVTHLDLVIANAGIADYGGSALDTPAEWMLSNYKINVVGPLLLF